MPDPERSDAEAQLAALRDAHEDDRAYVDAVLAATEQVETRDERVARAMAEEALRMSRDIGYDRGETIALLAVGTAYYLRQRNQEAFRLILEAQPRLEELGEDVMTSKALTVLAGLHYTMGNHQKCLECGYEALSLLEGQPTSPVKGWANYMLGDSYKALGDLDRAKEHFEQCRLVFDELGDNEGIGRGLNGIGNVYRMQGNLEASQQYFNQALELFRSENELMGTLRSLSDLALISQERGDYEQALRLFEESLAIRRERASPLVAATCLIDMGRLYLRMGRLDDAVASLSEALGIARAADHKPRIHACLEALSKTYRAMGDPETALDLYEEFHRVKEDLLTADTETRLQNLEFSLQATAAQKEAEMIKAHNDELKSKNDELSRLLKELRDTQEMLIQSEKMASLGQLTAGIAHEIKNPLNFVNNFSVMTKDLATELSDEIVEHREEAVKAIEREILDLASEITENADRILEHGRRAGQIVNGMLIHSRQSGGKKTEVDVNEFVMNCVDLAYHGFTATNETFEAAIDSELSGDAGTFHVIEDEVARVLTNILNNAFYALREGGGDAEKPRVNVTTGRSDGKVTITISDNGPGIPDEHKKKIFEPFFTTKPTGSGTGLGLSQSYEIITKRHGGTLSVSDRDGGGATFVVTLPA